MIRPGIETWSPRTLESLLLSLSLLLLLVRVSIGYVVTKMKSLTI